MSAGRITGVTTNSGPTAMYKPEFNLDGSIKHSRHCKAAFGRRDWNCHRCVELMSGAAPRKGWQHDYFGRKLRQSQRSFPW